MLNQRMVTSDEMSVMRLVEETRQQQANISKHDRINDPSIHGICTLVCGGLQEEVDSDQELVKRT